MATHLQRPTTSEHLFLWVAHRFADVFGDHAIIKGGLALRLLDSPRSTTDIDYVFAPYDSKKDILPRVRAVLSELEDAEVEVHVHSKMVRAELRVDGAAIQIEASVAHDCSAMAISTGGFARALGEPAQIVRIMRLDVALAHKLAAWNERRLLRDLYDCYFLAGRLREQPDLSVLDGRLAKVESRLPALRKIKRMSRSDLAAALEAAALGMTEAEIAGELAPVLPPEELAGLLPRTRMALIGIVETLRR